MEIIPLKYLDNKEEKSLLEQLDVIEYLKIEWTINNVSSVSQNQVLGIVTYTIRETKTRLFTSHEESNTYSFKILAPCNGYLYIDDDILVYQRNNDGTMSWEDIYPKIYDEELPQIAFIFQDVQELLSYHYRTSGAELDIDPYTKLRKIEWEFSRYIYIDYDILKLDFLDDKALFVFESSKKLQKGDCISLLFEGDKVIDYLIQNGTTKGRLFYEVSFTLYNEDVEMLLQYPLVSYRITYQNNRIKPETNHVYSTCYLGSFKDTAVSTYVRSYLDALHRLIPEYHLPNRTIIKKTMLYTFEGCYVYLMRDNTNGYHKIGISNKPEYREKTLQSEKPSIEMLACKKFPTRKIAESIESALHTTYSQQRIRGEWFKLDDVDVAAIIETLK